MVRTDHGVTEKTGIGVKIGGKVVNDLAICGWYHDHCRRSEIFGNIIEHASAKAGLELNLAKTKIKTIGTSLIFKIVWLDLEIVENQTFLSSLISKDGNIPLTLNLAIWVQYSTS